MSPIRLIILLVAAGAAIGAALLVRNMAGQPDTSGVPGDPVIIEKEVEVSSTKVLVSRGDVRIGLPLFKRKQRVTILVIRVARNVHKKATGSQCAVQVKRMVAWWHHIHLVAAKQKRHDHLMQDRIGFEVAQV